MLAYKPEKKQITNNNEKLEETKEEEKIDTTNEKKESDSTENEEKGEKEETNHATSRNIEQAGDNKSKTSLQVFLDFLC